MLKPLEKIMRMKRKEMLAAIAAGGDLTRELETYEIICRAAGQLAAHTEKVHGKEIEANAAGSASPKQPA